METDWDGELRHAAGAGIVVPYRPESGAGKGETSKPLECQPSLMAVG